MSMFPVCPHSQGVPVKIVRIFLFPHNSHLSLCHPHYTLTKKANIAYYIACSECKCLPISHGSNAYMRYQALFSLLWVFENVGKRASPTSATEMEMEYGK